MTSISEKFYFGSPVWLQNTLVSAYGYKLYKKRYTGIYNNILQAVRDSRDWNQDQINAYQNERLFSIVRHCRNNIPYYQKLFSEYGYHENSFTDLSALNRLPILDKQTLQSNIQLFRLPGEKAYITQNTSGSTGTPLSLDLDEYTYKLAMALVVEHEEYHGVPFGARRATFAGRMIQNSDDLNPPYARMNLAENQLIFSSYHLNANSFKWYYERLNKFAPLEIIGYPSAIADLATHYQLADVKPRFKPKAIVTNSETLLSWQRQVIEDVFGCKVFDYYGTAEYLIFAGQDNEGLYRLNPLIGITELNSSKSSEKQNRIIATSLTNYHMPLLRYDLRDTATANNNKTADSAISYLEEIFGRVDDYIETPDGRKIGRIDHIFKGVYGIKEAQVVQDSLNMCTINIVPRDNLSNIDTDQLKRNLISRTCSEMHVVIQEKSSIIRGANGKFKSVVNKLIDRS
ncbi:hypothetical protein [Marinobacter sp. PE14]